MGSNATDMDWPKIEAKVKIIVPNAPTAHVKLAIHKILRSFNAEVESFPFVSSKRNAMARSVPITAKLPIRDKYLKTVLKAIIGP